VDTSKAFDGDYKTDGYNQVMTTMDEFNKITQIMYDEGYVMVNLYDLADVDENGKMQAKQFIFLREKHRLFFRRTMYVITTPRMEMELPPSLL